MRNQDPWGNNQDPNQANQPPNFYAGQNSGNPYPYAGYSTQATPITMEERTSLAQKVMTFTFFSILAAVAGVFIGRGAFQLHYGSSFFIILIAFVGLSIATRAFRNIQGLNFLLLYSFAFVSGLVISPLIYILDTTGRTSTIYEALAITAGMTLALSGYAWFTQRDYSGAAPYLYVALIGIILVGLLNIFLNSDLLHSAWLYGGTVLFSCFLVFDVQRIRKYRDTIGNAIIITIEVYLDILNLFLFILRILNRR